MLRHQGQGGSVSGFVVLPPIERHYYFHALAGGGGRWLTSRR